MIIDLDLQVSEQLSLQSAETISYPSVDVMTSWIDMTIIKESVYQKKKLPESIELTIRLVDRKEIQELNKTYRQINKATNILSFAFEVPEFIPLNLLGDLVICHSIIEQEALQQHKLLNSHWAHIIIHGVLHLLNYDHIEDKQATEMETLEIQIMQQLGFDNPY